METPREGRAERQRQEEEESRATVSLPSSLETVAWQPVRPSNISHRMEACEEEPTADSDWEELGKGEESPKIPPPPPPPPSLSICLKTIQEQRGGQKTVQLIIQERQEPSQSSSALCFVDKHPLRSVGPTGEGPGPSCSG